MTPRRIVLLGGTGVLGQATLTRLSGHGHRIVAHSRGPVADDRPDVAWATGDVVTDPRALLELVGGADVVIDTRVALPQSAATLGALRQYRAVRDHAFGRVAAACARAGVPRLIHDTVTMVYRDGGDAWLDESSPVSAAGFLAANLAGEAHRGRFTDSGGVGVSLRLGMLYGEDPMSAAILAAARRGWFALPGVGYIPRLAVKDAARAVVAALEAPAGLYNVAEEPVTRARLREDYARRVGRGRLHRLPGLVGGPMARSQRVSSAAFRRVTGWCPQPAPTA